MAEIKATTSEKVFQITTFLGLNQNPDGDTKLKLGEAAVMDNFRITRDRNLQRRPGTKTVVDIGRNEPIKGLWVGYVGGTEYMLGACDGKMYKFWGEGDTTLSATEIGTVNTDGDVFVFGFENKAYILDGTQYQEWSGGNAVLGTVHGYRPLVKTSIAPENVTDMSGLLENVNRLCGERRVWLSPDGTGSTFWLPEIPASVDYVDDFVTAPPTRLVAGTDYTVEQVNGENTGKIIFSSVPQVIPQTTNRFEVGYSVSNNFRTDVEHMRYAELFAGTQETRVFLYGDGTNKTIYSGFDYNGKPRADYFPDLYEALVGDENTPITGMIRHYSSLACFKTDSAWSITASTLTTAEGLNIPAFYVTPVNKAIGLTAMGQVRLVMNSPYTVFGNDCYEWKNSSYYTSNLTRDERQAKRISDRVYAAISKFDLKRCYCYDNNSAQEYYICYDGEALVYNYAANAWSRYTAFPVNCMANVGDDLYIGTPDGKIKRFGTDLLSDDGNAITAYWESGSMGFGQEYMQKYSAMTWVVLKPESSIDLTISAKTDKKICDSRRIQTSSSQFSFKDFNFETLKWAVKYDTQVHRVKIKAKKFVFYKLQFLSNTAGTRCTVLTANIRVRLTGMAK